MARIFPIDGFDLRHWSVRCTKRCWLCAHAMQLNVPYVAFHAHWSRRKCDVISKWYVSVYVAICTTVNLFIEGRGLPFLRITRLWFVGESLSCHSDAPYRMKQHLLLFLLAKEKTLSQIQITEYQ